MRTSGSYPNYNSDNYLSCSLVRKMIDILLRLFNKSDVSDEEKEEIHNFLLFLGFDEETVDVLVRGGEENAS